MSGVQFSGAAIWQRPFDNGAIAQWSINGSRDSSAEYFIDGASNNGQMGSNNIGAVPVVDAVQEFNMMTNMYNAEYGHTGGGIMNVVLKSGTSQYHVHGLGVHAAHGAGCEYLPEQCDRGQPHQSQRRRTAPQSLPGSIRLLAGRTDSHPENSAQRRPGEVVLHGHL